MASCNIGHCLGKPGFLYRRDPSGNRFRRHSRSIGGSQPRRDDHSALWEEVTKGAFIVLLYIFAQRQIRGAWNGLFYGALVGTGFGITEDLVDLISNLDDFADLASAYMVREVFMAHLHPMFTASTGLAAGIAAQQGVSVARGLRWILYGFLVALTLHAIFDSATVFVTFATLILGPLYAVIAVIALRHLRRRREKAIAQGESA